MSKFIIGDVHGCFETLKALIAKLPKDAEIVLVGDLVDRGPSSCQVIDYVIENNIDCVKGNHEDMMWIYSKGIDVNANGCYITRGKMGNMWLLNGGHHTLKSYYEDDKGFNLPKFEEHREWVVKLPIYLEYPEVKKGNRKLVVSHSIIHSVWHREGKSKDSYFAETALWGRNFGGRKSDEIYNVFGHTPEQMGPTIRETHANVDTGACFKDIGYGVLTALEFPAMKIYTQENID